MGIINNLDLLSCLIVVDANDDPTYICYPDPTRGDLSDTGEAIWAIEKRTYHSDGILESRSWTRDSNGDIVFASVQTAYATETYS